MMVVAVAKGTLATPAAKRPVVTMRKQERSNCTAGALLYKSNGRSRAQAAMANMVAKKNRPHVT